MALGTYSDLQTSIANFAARSDLTSQIPDFITLAETMFNLGDDEGNFPPLRTRDMETTVTETVTSGTAPLPADFLQMKRVTVQSSPLQNLDYAPAKWMDWAYPTTDAGTPSFYDIVGTNLIIRPIPTDTVEYVYYAQIPALSNTNTTNWLLTKSPNAYLYAALYHLYIYTDRFDVSQFSGQLVGHASAMLTLAQKACEGLRRADRYARAGTFIKRASATAV